MESYRLVIAHLGSYLASGKIQIYTSESLSFLYMRLFDLFFLID